MTTFDQQPFNINFDESSALWRKNKIKCGLNLRYKCCHNDCQNFVYLYVADNKLFHLFPEEDQKIKHHPGKQEYCEEHLDDVFKKMLSPLSLR